MSGNVKVNVEGAPKDVAEFFKEIGNPKNLLAGEYIAPIRESTLPNQSSCYLGNLLNIRNVKKDEVYSSGIQSEFFYKDALGVLLKGLSESPTADEKQASKELFGVEANKDNAEYLDREELKKKLTEYGIEFSERARTGTLQQLFDDYEKNQNEASAPNQELSEESAVGKPSDQPIEPEIMSEQEQPKQEYSYEVVQEELKLYFARLCTLPDLTREKASQTIKDMILQFGGKEKVVDCDPSKYGDLVLQAQNNWLPLSTGGADAAQ